MEQEGEGQSLSVFPLQLYWGMACLRWGVIDFIHSFFIIHKYIDRNKLDIYGWNNVYQSRIVHVYMFFWMLWWYYFIRLFIFSQVFSFQRGNIFFDFSITHLQEPYTDRKPKQSKIFKFFERDHRQSTWRPRRCTRADRVQGCGQAHCLSHLRGQTSCH